MQKRMMALGVLLISSLSFSVYAEDMMRKERQYYEAEQGQVEFVGEPESARNRDREFKVNTTTKESLKDPEFINEGRLKDR